MRVENVSKTFITKKVMVEAVKNATFSLDEGGVAVIYGPSGSGKSVLLNIMAGFEEPDSGYVRYGGVDLYSLGWRGMNRFRRDYIGYCTQRDILLYRLSVRDNIALPLLIRGYSAREAYLEAGSIAETLGIGYALDRPAYTLSGGEQRRVVLARTLIIDAEILLIDEPTSGLDGDNAENVKRVIARRVEETGATTVISTHDRRFLDIADKVFKMESGVLSEADPMDIGKE